LNADSKSHQTPILDRKVFCAKYPGIAQAVRAGHFQWDNLRDIYADYLDRQSSLETFMVSLVTELGKVDGVHSTKARLKDPDHLIEKIIRRKWSRLTARTYQRRIDDLVGVRVLHLYKHDWARIHDYITKRWDLKERATANVRAGDPEELIQAFRERGCEIKRHRFGYRSIHYTIVSNPSREQIRAEIQVRTIFEEGWSEIDHRIRYPYDIENPLLGKYLVMFNRLAGSADEMGTFIQILKTEQEEQSRRLRKMKQRVKALADQLRGLSSAKGTNPNTLATQGKVDKMVLVELRQQLTESVRLAEDIRALQEAFFGRTGFGEGEP
jgi:ppGpp synthetase/RelA/SpoT-type nucleotidyltranferase